MRTLALSALLAAVVTSGLSPVAHARSDSEHRGRCHLTAMADAVSGQGTQTAELYAVVTVFSTGTPAENPVSATVTCYVTVNGAAQAGAYTSATGFTTIAVAGLGTFTTNSVTDVVHVCTEVDFLNTTPTTLECFLVSSTATAPLLGYIQITDRGAGPSYVLHGALADSGMWTCADNVPIIPYTVTCRQLASVTLDWKCDITHAAVATTSASGKAGAILACNGVNQVWTTIVTGVGGFDTGAAPSNAFVTEFSCTAFGPGWVAVPDYTVTCGDPGTPTVG